MKSIKNLAGQSSSSSKKFLKIWQQFVCFGLPVVSASGAWRRIHNKNMSQFFKNFRWRRALSSKVFHWFHDAKCYSEVKNEELSWKKLTSKLFGKLSYCANYSTFLARLTHTKVTIDYQNKFFTSITKKMSSSL